MLLLEDSNILFHQIGETPKNPAIEYSVFLSQIKYQYSPVLVKNLNGQLSCVEDNNGNGNYLFGEDDYITLADINDSHPILVSGRYSGCIFKVFQTRPGAFTCMHIYNPGRHSILRVRAEQYVQRLGGKDIAELGSTGLAHPGTVDSVWFVCELANANSVRISRLSVRSNGVIDHHFSGMFPGHSYG